jgi:hypothetical protein
MAYIAIGLFATAAVLTVFRIRDRIIAQREINQRIALIQQG